MSDANYTKRCPICETDKPASEFFKHKLTKDGLGSYCKICDYTKSRQWKEENKASQFEYMKAYREANRERLLAEKKKWYRANKEQHSALAKKWRQENKDKANGYSKKWSDNNPEFKRARSAKRRAIVKSIDGSHTAADVRMIYNNQNRCCAVCKTRLNGKFHVDHVVPVSAGGANDKDNLQILCAPCNLSKGAKDPIEFMQSRGYLL